MNQISWIEVFNSFTTFAVLAAIAFGILLLGIRKDVKPKAQKRK